MYLYFIYLIKKVKIIYVIYYHNKRYISLFMLDTKFNALNFLNLGKQRELLKSGKSRIMEKSVSDNVKFKMRNKQKQYIDI